MVVAALLLASCTKTLDIDKLKASITSTVEKNTSSKVRICENLGKLAVYTRSQHYKGLATKEAKIPAHIFSISENRILELHQKQHRDMFTHNKGYFMRAFPAGRRFDSSNPDPSLFWRGGVQMVAMNWQYLDEGMMLNEGMFADEKGWVLKPEGYQSSNKSAETQGEATPGRTMNLRITVFAGQHIPIQAGDAADVGRSASTLRPLIKAELHVDKPTDAERDAYMQEHKYKDKTDVGKTDHPDFGPHGSTLQFLNIPKVVEELSFIRLVDNFFNSVMYRYPTLPPPALGPSPVSCQSQVCRGNTSVGLVRSKSLHYGGELLSVPW